MIGKADIEGSKSNVAMNAWLPQAMIPSGCYNRVGLGGNSMTLFRPSLASYPCGNFSDTSS